jgi:hypothetical protein
VMIQQGRVENITNRSYPKAQGMADRERRHRKTCSRHPTVLAGTPARSLTPRASDVVGPITKSETFSIVKPESPVAAGQGS